MSRSAEDGLHRPFHVRPSKNQSHNHRNVQRFVGAGLPTLMMLLAG
jgi:hypothetical protein